MPSRAHHAQEVPPQPPVREALCRSDMKHVVFMPAGPSKLVTLFGRPTPEASRKQTADTSQKQARPQL